MADEKHQGSSLGLLAHELKKARIERELSIEEVSRMVQIPAGHIQKIEEGDYSFLPAIYVFSFIKKYADDLGVGDEMLLEECRRELHESGKDEKKRESGRPAWKKHEDAASVRRGGISGRERKRPLYLWVIIIATVGLLLLVLYLLFGARFSFRFPSVGSRDHAGEFFSVASQPFVRSAPFPSGFLASVGSASDFLRR